MKAERLKEHLSQVVEPEILKQVPKEAMEEALKGMMAALNPEPQQRGVPREGQAR